MDSPCIKQTVCKVLNIFQHGKYLEAYVLKETKSATMNIFQIFFLFKSVVKVELGYVFTIDMFTIAEHCTEK